MSEFDAVVIGSGPNGMAAAITLAQAQLKVLVIERANDVGGGARSAESTLPGFMHDVCSAVHPMAIASPFFNSLPLSEHGLEWIHAPFSLAHPFDDHSAAILTSSIQETAEYLGKDFSAYEKLMDPWRENWENLFKEILQTPLHVPTHPLLLMRFGLDAIRSVSGLADALFVEKKARGLFAGLGGHSFLPLEQAPSAAIALVLGIAAHAKGWPMPRGGAQKLSQALLSFFQSLGGSVRTNCEVKNLSDIPPARFIFFDLMPRQILKIGGEKIPPHYRKQLENFRLGPGVFKVDYALSEAIPWKAAECKKAGTVHLGGSFEEIAASERAHGRGEYSEHPFVLLTQPSLFDGIRAPAGKHIAWAYCHVPRASTKDMSQQIDAQIERFAPGFREIILAKKSTSPQALELYNPNYWGGDISGGIADFKQLLFRPTLMNPYKIPVKGWYLCSAATPPGSGVHGMCGYHAARCALNE